MRGEVCIDTGIDIFHKAVLPDRVQPIRIGFSEVGGIQKELGDPVIWIGITRNGRIDKEQKVLDFL